MVAISIRLSDEKHQRLKDWNEKIKLAVKDKAIATIPPPIHLKQPNNLKMNINR